MSKQKATYACTACGSQFPKWLGRCSTCGEYATIQEAAAPKSVGLKASGAGSTPARAAGPCAPQRRRP